MTEVVSTFNYKLTEPSILLNLVEFMSCTIFFYPTQNITKSIDFGKILLDLYLVGY